uniref:PIPK domain-containing protein n=1 Tax=Periophthalmus magnuspinnatus TaxID=409849 RepID=A0A3B4BEP9_9GOBI
MPQILSLYFNLKTKMADSTVSRAARRRRRWWHLRQQWSMLGVFEISADHEFFRLTTFIKEGTRVSIQKGVVSDRPSGLTEEDYRKKEQQTHKGFSMETYAAPVFRFLRCSVGISEEQYLDSLCSDQCYVQFISNSKSKADFFVTHDKRFFLKTQSRREVQFLLNKLKAYVQHLEKNPHSIMVRFMGTNTTNTVTKYFIVMQSVFFPDERIDIRYDLKGCEVGRWTDPDTKGKHIIKVLKDNNFQEHITLGPEKSWFVEQVRADVEFLRGLNVLDYSLLLAHQPLHQDDSDPDALPLAPLSLPSGLRDFGEHHRRLLPNCENAVHVIDGEDKRYFVGIIDIFTVYGCKKRLESLWKTLRFPGRSFSTVSPRKYSARFCQWIQGRTK